MRDYSQEDRRVRERLQKQAGPNEGRSNLLGKLAALAAVDAVAGRGAEVTLDGLRRMAQSHAAIVRGHNQRHDPWLRQRRIAASRPDFLDEDDARDEPHVTPVSASGRSPGVVQIRDSGGSMRGDRRTVADHFGDNGTVSAAESVLSIEDLRHLAAQKWRSRSF